MRSLQGPVLITDLISSIERKKLKTVQPAASGHLSLSLCQRASILRRDRRRSLKLGNKRYGHKTDSCFEGSTRGRNRCICENSWCDEGCRWREVGSSSSCNDSRSNCSSVNKTGAKGCF